MPVILSIQTYEYFCEFYIKESTNRYLVIDSIVIHFSTISFRYKWKRISLRLCFTIYQNMLIRLSGIQYRDCFFSRANNEFLVYKRETYYCSCYLIVLSNTLCLKNQMRKANEITIIPSTNFMTKCYVIG